MTAQITKLPKANPAVMWTSVSDGAVLFSTTDEIYYGLNDVGALIWQLLPPATSTLDALCAGVAARYPDAALDVIRSDVEELLDDLVAHGLVEQTDD